MGEDAGMHLTFNAAILLCTFWLAGIVEFAAWCHEAPEASLSGE